ncbi:MAG: hypothetical protein WBH57_11845 [Anaerolineae bacterium]
MKLSTLFTITGVGSIVFGLAFVLVPGRLASPYGLELDEAGIMVLRLLGATFLGYGALNWFARNTEESRARQAIVLAQSIGNAIAFIVALVNQLSGVPNAVGWAAVVVHLLLALGYGYFEFMWPSASQPTSFAQQSRRPFS